MPRLLFVGLCLVAALSSSPLRAQDAAAASARWQHIQELRQQLSAPVPPGVNEAEASAPIEAQLHQEAAAYANDFPADARQWDARLLALKSVFFPADPAARRAIFEQQEKSLADFLAPDAPVPLRRDAERAILFQHLNHLDLIETPAEAAALEARITDFVRRFPDDLKAGALQVRRLDLLRKSDSARAAELLASLSASPDPRVASAAKGRQEQAALSAAPLDWKFTALDGTPVDLAQWRGRVVLVDFWACWCPDCLRELPEVKAAYEKYHDQGLEIVGVSLDHDQAALQAFVKKHALPWPQQYDGKGWDAELPVRYGVRGIPEMWLADRAGRVVATGLHGSQLDAQVAEALKH